MAWKSRSVWIHFTEMEERSGPSRDNAVCTVCGAVRRIGPTPGRRVDARIWVQFDGKGDPTTIYCDECLERIVGERIGIHRVLPVSGKLPRFARATLSEGGLDFQSLDEKGLPDDEEDPRER